MANKNANFANREVADLIYKVSCMIIWKNFRKLKRN